MSEAMYPIPVFISRHNTCVDHNTPGDTIGFNIGERAEVLAKDGKRHPVEIASGLVGHSAAPGEWCYEVYALEENRAKFCVSAKQLRLPQP